ncbi:MAG: acyl carrier protein [Rhodospirillales bacterium]|nr:acyl carrier protein [Rhodospirillales bacterium]
MGDLESELKTLIVTTLKLEDLAPEDIDSDEPLFGDSGLGLDSIDALEIGVSIRKIYGIKIDSASDEVKKSFACIRNLADFVRAHREAVR